MAPLGIEVLQAVVRVNPDAIVWRGDPTLPGRTKACGFWAHHWDSQTLFVPSCLRCLRHMTSCSRRSSPFKISSVLGCSLLRCSGKLHPQSGPPGVDRNLQPTTTLHSGDASATFLGLLLPSYWDLASLPLCLGGLGLLSATLLARPAFWASWADCLEMIHQRHPTVCARIVDALHAQHPHLHLDGVRASGEHLASAGFHAPSQQELAAGARPGLAWMLLAVSVLPWRSRPS